MKENAEALVVAAKEIGLEVNADKTKYMVMSGEQTAGLSHTMTTLDHPPYSPDLAVADFYLFS